MYAFEEFWDSAAQAQYHFHIRQRHESSHAQHLSSATRVSGAAGSDKSHRLNSMLRKRYGSGQQLKHKPAVGSSRLGFSQMAVAEAISSFDSQALHANSLLPRPCASNKLPSPFFDNLASLPAHGGAPAISQLPVNSYDSSPTVSPSVKLGVSPSDQDVSTSPLDYCVAPERKYDTAWRAAPHTFTAMLNSNDGSSFPTGQKQLQVVGADLHANQPVHSSHPRMYSIQISSRAVCIPPQESNCPNPDSPFTTASSQAKHGPQSTQPSVQLLNRLTESFSVTASSGGTPPPAPRRPQPQHLHSLALKKFPCGARPVQSSKELLNKLLKLSTTVDTASSH